MRGFWYTLEAVLAGILLIGFLLAVNTFYLSPRTSEPQPYLILKGLDEQGILRAYAVADDYSGLNSQIDTAYNHSVEICSTGCVGEKSEADNVFVGRYFVSGENSYDPKEVRLYLW
ncbi:MAG: hypothetical protein ISS36_00780 [Candidatus Aenigmarchaeota archaeon]|nr:hypothetical protein [Candidatus Aenigmarchaeota archaeon]